MSASVSDAATTVTEATPSGGRPVRASTRCAPRCAVPDVATAPVCTGTTATSRLGSCGSSMPIRHDLAAAQPGDVRVGPLGAEHPVDLAEHLQHLDPRGPRAPVGGVPAAQSEADRHPHDALD